MMSNLSHDLPPTLRRQARLRLFCFPYAGGGTSIFRTWSRYLPPSIEIYPVQLPGRESRLMEEPFHHMADLVEYLGQTLLPQLDGPYAFFGHSMGALIGFELARYLRRRGHSPAPVHLYVASHRAPQLPDPHPATYHLPEPEFIAELRRLQGTPEEILQSSELLQLILPLLRADFTVCQTYQYTIEPPLAYPISAFAAQHDGEVTYEAAALWEKQTEDAFNLRLFDGNHFFLHTEQFPFLQALLQELNNDLRELR
jgi:medium-chain acyl-[acyl-carrier-protein] hydrolase